MRWDHWLYTIPLRLRSLFRRGKVEQELDEEFQYHLEMRHRNASPRARRPKRRDGQSRAAQGTVPRRSRDPHDG